MYTDFHAHVLPGIDDGSKSREESLAMLQLLSQQGVERVVATPHFYPQYDAPERFLQRRAEAFARLKEKAGQADLPEIVLGAEVYYYRGISESDFLTGLTFGKNQCILIEMPMGEWSDSMYRELSDIREKQGLIPVIAHVDRYLTPFHTDNIPERLARLPVYVQANCSAFLRFGMRKAMLRLLQKGKIHLLGSDCHDMHSRSPNMKEALSYIESKGGLEAIEQLRLYENLVF